MKRPWAPFLFSFNWCIFLCNHMSLSSSPDLPSSLITNHNTASNRLGRIGWCWMINACKKIAAFYGTGIHPSLSLSFFYLLPSFLSNLIFIFLVLTLPSVTNKDRFSWWQDSCSYQYYVIKRKFSYYMILSVIKLHPSYPSNRWSILYGNINMVTAWRNLLSHKLVG